MLAVLLLALSCHLSMAEIFVLKHESVPPALSLKHINNFYAFSEKDSPVSFKHINNFYSKDGQDRSLGSPFIRFWGFVAYPNGSQNLPVDYRGLQITVLPLKDLWKVIDANKFCSDGDDVSRGNAQHTETLMLQKEVLQTINTSVFVHHIHLKAARTTASDTMDLQIPIRETGTYSILLSNCGGFTEAQINGSITVRNAYGYLPGNEYRKLPFYICLSLVYILLCLLWIYLSIKRRSGLFKIHVFIGLVLITGFNEAAIWCATLMDWNSTGFRPVNLNIVAVVASVVKSAGFQVLALLASLGWGLWRPHLECETVVKAGILGLLMVIADFIHDYLPLFRQTRPTSMTTIFLSWAPVALLNCICFAWVLRALTGSIDVMQQRKQEEKLLQFERLWNVLVLALTMAAVAVSIQAYVITRTLDVRWRYQWFFPDVGPQILFAFVLVAMMYLWAPSKGSERYAYMHVASNEVEAHNEQDNDTASADAGDAVWVVNDNDVFGEDEEAVGDTFWDATKASNSKVAPEPDLIGISTDD